MYGVQIAFRNYLPARGFFGSRDGHVVVTHDNTVDRTGSGSGYIKDKSLEELRGLDFGSWFKPCFKDEKIPLLQQVMELAREADILLNIEIKADPGLYAEGIEKKVIEVIKAYSMINRVIISFFNHYCLKEVKRLEPRIKTGILYSEVMYEPWKYARGIGAKKSHSIRSNRYYIECPRYSAENTG